MLQRTKNFIFLHFSVIAVQNNNSIIGSYQRFINAATVNRSSAKDSYPDNSIRIYECLDNVRMISKLLSSNGVIIDEISVQGENLETYFENLIGGRKNV